ncbi:tRNA threonylcarbamoyladenosine dehydratase [Undibacterium sp. SXout7W]|uniref:tRNA threonylcarbamoyladenosine dehydratase n=1 Tax=Undibacterium sp. SXout7W TaxID=3413049 RepID=UPI003BF0FA84
MAAEFILSPIMQQHTDIDFERRFGGVGRLYGAAALERFKTAHVCIIGVGGVGSWVVEALARSAIGRLTMIDLDNVAESNINRQIQAHSDTLGKAKVSALSERIALINPYCQVTEVEDFVTPDNLEEMLGQKNFDYVIDAIDNVKAKTALIAYCSQQGIPLITIGAAGGQMDPGKIEIRDLSRTEQEPLLALVRKRLRQNHGFPRGAKSKFGIDAVFSMEVLTMPETAEACAVEISSENEQVVNSENGGNAGITGLNCAGFGSSIVVTASFGMAAAAYVLRQLARTAADN